MQMIRLSIFQAQQALLDNKFEELQARELEEHQRETEFSQSVEEARRALEDDRKRFEAEKEEFERSHPEPEEEPDSGIGSRNESAELYEADEEDEVMVYFEREEIENTNKGQRKDHFNDLVYQKAQFTSGEKQRTRVDILAFMPVSEEEVKPEKKKK